MKNLMLSCLLLAISLAINAQTLVQRNFSPGASKSGRYYEYLPKGYTSTRQYPVIIFTHGLGETEANGPLSIVLRHGLMAFLNTDAQFRDTFKCIVIAPQWRSWPYGDDMAQVLDYTQATYSIDVNRIYATGLSMGGAATWALCSFNEATASRIAAIMPICGASSPDSYGMTTIAKTGVAVWATHNSDDGTVSVNQTHGWVDGINARTPKIIARKTIWPTGGHNSWARTHDPSNTEFDGGNAYDWMLRHSRNAPVVTPPATAQISFVCGQPAFISWEEDTKYLASQTAGWVTDMTALYGPNHLTISGTTQPKVYNAERFGTFTYSVPVTAGTYMVTLHFAELYWNTAGQRTFNVDIEGVRVLSNFDVLSQAGGKFKAIQRTFNATVTDGRLDFVFAGIIDKAKVNAVEIKAAGSPPAYFQVNTIQYLDSATNFLLKQYTDTFRAPVKIILK